MYMCSYQLSESLPACVVYAVRVLLFVARRSAQWSSKSDLSAALRAGPPASSSSPSPETTAQRSAAARRGNAMPCGLSQQRKPPGPMDAPALAAVWPPRISGVAGVDSAGPEQGGLAFFLPAAPARNWRRPQQLRGGGALRRCQLTRPDRLAAADCLYCGGFVPACRP